MACPAYENDLRQLRRYPDMKYGFIVYRCTTDSDTDWKQFMTYLDTTVRASTVESGMGEMLDRIDWCVQEKRGLNSANLNMDQRVEKVRA